MRTVLLGLAFLLLSATMHAQDPPKTEVVFICSCSDSVGAAFATRMRDALARSPRYVELTTPGDAVRWTMSVVSISVNGGSEAAALAVVFRMGSIYIDQAVHVCGSQRVERCVTDVFSEFDQHVVDLRKAVSAPASSSVP